MIKIFFAIWLLLLPINSFAQSLQNFATLPILHEGRVKPLESFARVELWQLSGAEKWQGQTATQWLANTIFKPETMLHQKFFAIKNPSQRLQLGLDDGQKFVSFAALHHYFQKNKVPENPDWQMLYAHYLDYSALLSSLTLVLPLPFAPQLSYLDVHKNYATKMAMLVKQKGTHLKSYNLAEKQLAASTWQLNAMEKSGVTSFILQVIPHGKVYLSPWGWQIENPKQAAALKPWQQAAFAYRNQDAKNFDIAVNQLHPQNNWRLQLETWYQRYKPMLWAEAFYGLGLALFLLTAFKKRLPNFKKIALFSIMVGATCHAASLLCRVIILQRPPSGTLYETLLFVSFITIVTGLLYKRQHNHTPTIIGAGLALLQLFVAPIFKPQGDSLEVLQAVLNTNFWLTIHVLIITAGYAVSVLAASLAHAALYKKTLISFADVYKLLILALFLTSFGTMLGGIWADQSWGRFWGWDPKENGALLLALWLVWLLHGRVSGHLQPRALLAWAAATNIIVALSWFGVNLLNVGLHSYGFVEGVAGGLATFCGLEILSITWLWWRDKQAA